MNRTSWLGIGVTLALMLTGHGEAEPTPDPIIRKIPNVAGEIRIDSGPEVFNLTFTHENLGKPIDCGGFLRAEVIIGDKGRSTHNLHFWFDKVAPDETHNLELGKDLLDDLRWQNRDVDPNTIVFDTSSKQLSLKKATCLFGPPIDIKPILDNEYARARIYVDPTNVHALYRIRWLESNTHVRCEFGISAAVLNSKFPERPIEFKIHDVQVADFGLTHTFAGADPLNQRRLEENNPELIYDGRPGKTQVVTHHCWRGGSSQFETDSASSFFLFPGGKEAVMYSPNKERGVVVDVGSELEGVSMESKSRGVWQAMSLSADGKQFAVSKFDKVSIYDATTYKELGTFASAEQGGDISFHAGKNMVVQGDKIFSTHESKMGKVINSFIRPLLSYAFTPDGRYLIGSKNRKDNKAIVIPTDNLESHTHHVRMPWTTNITVTSDSKKYLFSSRDYIYLADIATGSISKGLVTPSEVIDIAIAQKDKVIAVLNRKTISLWDYEKCNKFITFPYEGFGEKIDIVDKGKTFVVGLKRRLVRKNLVDFWTVDLSHALPRFNRCGSDREAMENLR